MWLALGIGLGILAARFRGRIVDRLSTIFVLIGTSLPTFLTGLILLVFVVIRWGLIPFPSGNYTSFFENPFEFDIHRNPNPHLSFGFGTHLCIGANLARLVLTTVFRELSGRATGLSVVSEPDVEANIFARAVKSFQIRVTPR